MSITKENKKEIISKFATNKKDTGSAEVQIAVISERINNLIAYNATGNCHIMAISESALHSNIENKM